jgi:hypothetical protein
MFNKYYKTFNLILITIIILGCNNSPTEPDTTENKMYVYSNYGNTFYLVDYKTYEVIKEIQLSVPDTVKCNGMILSTDRNYLFFKAEGQYPYPPFGFAIYNIENEKLENVFFTEFRGAEPAYFISAQNNSEPGLIYIHFRDFGTYSIDLFAQKIKEFISDEHDFDLDKRIFHSPNGLWTIVKKNWEATGYTELEFYTSSSKLHNLEFVLNKDNVDSLRICDWAFSKDNRLFIMYLPGPIRDVPACFGGYNLETKQLFHTPLKFPWSLSGYYLAYSSNRNEVYAVGSNGQFYIIDPDAYSIKDTIRLSIGGEQSPIVITPEENLAFVAYPNSNSIYAIDLNERKLKKTIYVDEPYNMIIP